MDEGNYPEYTTEQHEALLQCLAIFAERGFELMRQEAEAAMRVSTPEGEEQAVG